MGTDRNIEAENGSVISKKTKGRAGLAAAGIGLRLRAVSQVWLSFSVFTSTRLTALSAFFLGTALFYAPTAYGCMRPESLPGLYALLIAFFICGRVGLWLANRRPELPRLALVCIALILIQGWWLTLDPVFNSVTSFNGGTVNATTDDIRSISFQSMGMITIMLATFLLLCELLASWGSR
jgi:hypothetical protein